MAKLLRIGDYVLLTAALIGDTLTEIHNVGEVMPWIMKTRYGFVPPNYRKTNYLSAISRSISVGDIKRKTDSQGKTYLELTSIGQTKYKRRFPVFSNNNLKWDGNFMVVIFDIPEKERKNRVVLRRKLIELGFGMLQKSVFISPYHFEEDLREFLEINNLGDTVFVLTAKKLLGGNTKELIEKTWHLDEIKKKYEKILNCIESESSRKKIWEDYLAVLRIDPMVPEDLYQMKKLRDDVAKSLSK